MVLTMGVAESPTLGFRHQLLSGRQHSDDVPGMAGRGTQIGKTQAGPEVGMGS